MGQIAPRFNLFGFVFPYMASVAWRYGDEFA
jgi:hypothetical protein